MKLTFFTLGLAGMTTAKFSELGTTFESEIQAAADAEQGGDSPLDSKAIVSMIGADAFDNIDGYGCWCYFDDEHGKGKSHPVNEIDAFCKALHEGYECAIIDADNEGDLEACIPWEVFYVPGAIGETDQIVSDCESRNDNNCATRACIIETQFVTSMFRFTISGGSMDDSAKHENGFDVEENCPTTPGSPSEKDCCGHYPYRHPFKTYGGQRSCCGMKTYDITVLNCCPNGKVRVNC
jgi:hypothetical protein